MTRLHLSGTLPSLHLALPSAHLSTQSQAEFAPKNGLQNPGIANPTWRDLEEVLARQVEEIKVQHVKDRQDAIEFKSAWNEL